VAPGVKRCEKQGKSEESDVGDDVLGAADHKREGAVEGEAHPRDIGASREEQAHGSLQEPGA